MKDIPVLGDIFEHLTTATRYYCTGAVRRIGADGWPGIVTLELQPLPKEPIEQAATQQRAGD
jgi:hypothetical protein